MGSDQWGVDLGLDLSGWELGYITFIGCLYYFNVLNVKVKNGILGEFEIGMLK